MIHSYVKSSDSGLTFYIETALPSNFVCVCPGRESCCFSQATVQDSWKAYKPGPVNLGSGIEITITDLVALIGEPPGFDGKIVS